MVRKYSGIEQEYNAAQLRKALLRAGAAEPEIEQIVNVVERQLYQGIHTRDIYGIAFRLLKESRPSMAARYNLKRGIMELGPTGFPFEHYVAELMKGKGYATQVGVVIQGKCVKHEVDVIAEKGNEHLMIECKYHSQQGKVCDVKVPLYIQSRFLDVQASLKGLHAHAEKLHRGWVVTNTRLTQDAIQYGNCVGLYLWAWDYPGGNGLKDVIDKTALYPLTCLTSLTAREKSLLLSKQVVLCRQLCERPESLAQIGISLGRQDVILHEAKELCVSLNKKHGN